jgi:hypothetical protein
MHFPVVLVQLYHVCSFIRVLRTNTAGKSMRTTLMLLQNESKHNDNWIKGRLPQNKNIEILSALCSIFNDF